MLTKSQEGEYDSAFHSLKRSLDLLPDDLGMHGLALTANLIGAVSQAIAIEVVRIVRRPRAELKARSANTEQRTAVSYMHRAIHQG